MAKIKSIAKFTSKTKFDPTMFFQGLEEVRKACENYKITAEVEKTKRVRIEAEKDAYIERIHAQRDVMLNALDNSFKERKSNFKELFDKLDQALESDKDEIVGQILGSIVDLAKNTPFKDIQRTISDFHSDDVQTIEI